ncbi:MAG: hypothetical protein JSW71_10320 [Gemmatimonadota bacterium]|nr:MAG: hypothetical protein JSW71_10320 [Gemmatimonadota bacterium]
MLEADATELEARSGSQLSVHVGECSDCAAIARSILAQQQELQRVLGGERPRTNLDAALSRARARALAVRRRRKKWQGAVSLAAAGLAGILIYSVSRDPLPESEWRTPEQSAAVGLDIEAPPGKNVAVFEIADRPDIVVVWFYDQ